MADHVSPMCIHAILWRMQSSPGEFLYDEIATTLDLAGGCDQRVACHRRLGCSWLAMNVASLLADLDHDQPLQAA